jgi:Ca2+-binding RTX toxin-like protein
MAERAPAEESSQPTGGATASPDRVLFAAQEASQDAAQSATGMQNPWILTAKPGLVIELPFALASAGVELRGDDLYVRAGDLLVVVKGYGPALDAGDAPAIVDPAGAWFSTGVPTITAGTPVVLTDSPAVLPPKPAELTETPSQTTKLFGGALLTPFDLDPSTGPRPSAGASSPLEGHAAAIIDTRAVPDFGPLAAVRFLAPGSALAAPPPFDAVDDKSGVNLGAAAGNVIAGLGGGTDIQIGGTVTAVAGAGAPVAVTAGGVDVAGQYGTLHIAADGAVTYQRTVGDVADLAALPNGATDVFTYTLTNGDNRTDSATLSFALMPVTIANGNAAGTGNDEALLMAPGAHGTLTGLAGEDRLFGGSGDDKLDGGADNDYLAPGAGNDQVTGGSGDDTLDLAGHLDALDKIDGGGGKDRLLLDGDYSAGVTFTATTLVNVESILLADGHSYSFTLNDATNATGLAVDGGALTGANRLSLDGSAEKSAALTAIGGEGDDVLKGGAGNDTLTGNGGNDTLTAGAGIDVLSGGAGNDVFVLGANLTAADKIDGGGDNDTLQLAGNYSAGLTFAAGTMIDVETIQLADGFSYKLTLNDATNAAGLTVDGSALGSARSVVLNGAAETSAALTALGGAGADTLTGNAGADILTAGSGNDTLAGGAGDDVFVLAGNLTAADKIDGGADRDVLQLDGNYAGGMTFAATTMVNVETVKLADGHSYKFTLNDANNTTGLTFDGSALTGGNKLTVGDSAEKSASFIAIGGTGDDAMTGGAGNDTLTGNAGNDVLTGNAGNDLLVAGAGNDTLSGGAGNDTLDLGANLNAADKIDGGANVDTLKLDGDYVAGVVFGATTVTNIETILLAAGHDYKLTLNNATNTAGLTVDGSALGVANTLVLNGSAETASALTALGGAGDDVLIGGTGSDKLAGGAGNDTLTAGAGNDTLSGGSGNDVFNLGANLTAADKIDGGADYDIVRLQGNYSAGITLGAATLTGIEEIDLAAGNSYKLTLNDANDTAGLKIDGTLLAAGQVMTVSGAAETDALLTLLGGAGGDVLTAGARDDTLDGGAGNDTLTPGAGEDTIRGGAGNDTMAMLGNLDAGDRIDGGADFDTVTLNGDYAAGIVFTAATMVNVEAVTLAAGHSYRLTLDDATNTAGLTVNAAALAAANTLVLDGSAELTAALTATGGAGDDRLVGGAGNDVLAGGNGNDTLVAGAGIDALAGGAGNDTLDLGANLTAADKIDGGAGIDTLKLDGDYSAGVALGAATVTNVEAITVAAGHDYKLVLNNATNTTSLTVDASALGSANAISLDGSAETSSALTATGGAGNDTLIGGGGSDLLDGGAGDDVLSANGGTDKLLGGAGNDVFVLGANLTAADQIDGGAGYDIVTLAGNYASGLALGATTLTNVEEIGLASGNSYKLSLVDANDTSSLTIDGSVLSAGQVLTVNGAAETASPLILLGGAGDDALTGGAGGDTLKGGLGNDTLTPGAGVDSVDGGAGNDTIVMAGNLTAADKIDGGADLDTVTLNGNYSAGLTFGATTMVNVETLRLGPGSSYALTLDDATNTAGLTVDGGALLAPSFLHLDGSAETGAALTAVGGGGDDVLTGGAGGDVFNGGAGNDTLSGNGGDDTLTAGAGIDTLNGGAGQDTFVLGANLTAADKIDGGGDADTLNLAGNYASGVTFTATTVVNVEAINLADGFSYKLTLNDATNTAGLHVDGHLLSAGRTVTIDGSAETSATLTVDGGAGNDVLTGGAGADHLNGGGGNDVIKGNAGGDFLFGGAGDDTLTGGTGADTFTFNLADTGKDKVTDFKLAEGDILEFSNVVDGAGNDIQDLIAAGVTAIGSGGNCVVSWNGGASTVTLTNVGGAVANLSELAALLGSQLYVTH